MLVLLLQNSKIYKNCSLSSLFPVDCWRGNNDFQSVDRCGSGTITLEDLKRGLLKLATKFFQFEVRQLIEAISWRPSSLNKLSHWGKENTRIDYWEQHLNVVTFFFFFFFEKIERSNFRILDSRDIPRGPTFSFPQFL